MNNNHTIEECYSFLACPYRFPQEKQIHNTVKDSWQQALQNSINDIIETFYRITYEERTSLRLFALLSQNWENFDRSLFLSQQHFILVCATVTDHLLKLLTTVKEKKNPFLNLSEPTFEKGEVVIEKVLVDVDEELFSAYCQTAMTYSYNAYKCIPKRIEVFDILNAKRYVHYPGL
ncbi:hypothetical protein [Bacillus suaedae]|uniref:Uncharacterized protein n=1 Tax=Halalkalibacter suaedae TaxID=2822140 RepID=A0A940WYT8_9BACI|nr:hypothetical protein [Bacillus suaedae]MBP3953317.1 hypothetical protein [Bacillus suaedae]